MVPHGKQGLEIKLDAQHFLDLLAHPVGAGQTLLASVVAVDWCDDQVGCHHCVKHEITESGWAVKQDEVELILHVLEAVEDAVLGRYLRLVLQQNLSSNEIERGGSQLQVLVGRRVENVGEWQLHAVLPDVDVLHGLACVGHGHTELA